jgi:hypothetical protein
MPRPMYHFWRIFSGLGCMFVLVGVLLSNSTVHAQPQASCACPGTSQRLGAIRVTVRAIKSADELIWVLKAVPDAAALLIDNSDLRRNIQTAIAQTTEGLQAAQFGLSDAAEFNFLSIPAQALVGTQIIWLPTGALTATPRAEDEEQSGEICICGPATARPAVLPPTAYRVVVVLKTAFAARAARESSLRSIQQEELTLENLPVKLFFTQRDLMNAAPGLPTRKQPRARAMAEQRTRVVDELRAVAQRLITLARTHKLLDNTGKLTPTPTSDPNEVSAAELDDQRRTAFQIARDAMAAAFRDAYELKRTPGKLPLRNEVKWRGLELPIGTCDADRCAGGPLEPCNGLCGTPPQPVFVIGVEGLQLVRHVALKVQPDETDEKFNDQPVARDFNEMRRVVAKKLNQQFKDQFSAKPGHIVDWEQIKTDLSKLCPNFGTADQKCQAVAAIKQISSPPKRMPVRGKPANNNLAANPPNNSPGNSPNNAADTQTASMAGSDANAVEDENYSYDSTLIYEVLRKRKTPGALGISAGARYSPEDSFLATLGLREYNLLGFGKLSLREHISLDFARGDQAQKLRFQLARPFAAPKRSGFRVKDVSLAVNYFRDQNQRLGNLTPAEIEARELGSSAAVSFGYDSFKPEDYQLLNCDCYKTRKRTHATLNGDASLGFRDLNIPESRRLLTLTGLDEQLLPRTNTQHAPLALNLTLALTHDARQLNKAGLGQINVSLDTKLQRGLDLFGADYRYHKTALTARAETVFGKLSPEDFFLRYTHGLGQGSAQTPVTELFRLGGQQSVRGMEEGEFIGRRLSFGQAEFGVNVFALWHLLRRTPAPELNRTPCSKGTGTDAARSRLPFDPAGIYLKTFFDHARLTDPTSFTNLALGASLLPRRLDQRANGYGVALELRNLSNDIGAQVSLTFGYARSPQSRLHPSGTLFTGVSYSF